MRYFPLLCIVILIILSACKKETGSNPVDVETQDRMWMKLSITGQQRGVSAIYGSLDDTLVVATTYRIYMTTDGGASWEEVWDQGGGTTGFYMVNGELCALGTRMFQGDTAFAIRPFLYSLDHGKTWSYERKFDYEVYDAIQRYIERISVDDHTYYRIDNNLKPMDNLDMSFLHGPNKIIKGWHGVEEDLYFPFQRYLNCLHLDDKQRLYVGAEGVRFEEEINGNIRVYPASSDSAIVYVTRMPISELP